MSIDSAMRILGPVVLLINFATTFLCLRPKRGVLFTFGVYAVYAAATCAVVYLTGIIDSPWVTVSGVMFLPVNLYLFKGQASQIVFAFFLP